MARGEEPAPNEGALGEALAVAGRPDYWAWHAQVARSGGCAQPIWLAGSRRLVQAGTGVVLSCYDTSAEATGHLLIPCGNRRSSRCPACSEVYRADTYQLLRAGLAGGKGVPASVRGHPRLFVTLTAPSFGAVHHRLVGPGERVQRCHPHADPGCGRRHGLADPDLGTPLDPRTYDYVGAVIWNAQAPRLWDRTISLLRRTIASAAGLPQRDFTKVARLSFDKVAEYQARGLVHFHAVIRLDGIDPDERDAIVHPPGWAAAELIADAVRAAAAQAKSASPEAASTGGARLIRWGAEVDIAPIRAVSEVDDLSEGAVAGYVAKYATKGAECTATLDTGLCCRSCEGTGRHAAGRCADCHGTGASRDLDTLAVPEHTRRMIQTCWSLGDDPDLVELKLRRWAHMLGYGGHFSTKSRRYSTTLTTLRHARRDWNTARTLAALGLEPSTPVVRQLGPNECNGLDGDVVVIVGEWRYVGRGHSPGEAVLARSIAEDIAANRRTARDAARQQEIEERDLPA